MALTNGTSHGDKGLKILIAGAGIGGLTAAIALRRQGHHVHIFEQSKFSSETGAAIHLAPNANGVLKQLGISAEDTGANLMEMMTEYTAAGEQTRSIPIAMMGKMWQHEWLLAHRVHLHKALKDKALSTTGEGHPAELHLSSPVSNVNTSTATLTLKDGTQVSGDVIIGADGVHSVTRSHIPGGDVKPFGSGKSAFRFLMEREVALADPATRKFAEKNGELIIMYSSDRRVVMYPTSHNQILNFVCIHPENESDATGDWNSDANKSTLLEVYKDFHPDCLKLLEKAEPSSLKVWKLLDMAVLPSWVNDRLALLGDAAHPFLPHQGQGGACAIEDAASLGVVLERGITREEVPARLALYEKIRCERANRIQEYTRIAGRDVQHDKKLNIIEYTNYNFGHDEIHNSTQRLREWKWAQTPNVYWRMPIVFGPMPGPRQSHTGSVRAATESTFTTASVKFKTSRTILQNLFPPGQKGWRFKSPGTVAYASFSQTTLNKMEWLAGSGYHHIGLYIHGVEYVKADGQILSGTYLPILFESLADPIISGREELGMPKLYSAIDVHRRADSYRINTSWQGAVWGNFVFKGLKEVAHDDDLSNSKSTNNTSTAGKSSSNSPTATANDDTGLLLHRYIPKVGREHKGSAEAQYPVFSPYADEKPQPVTKRMWQAEEVSVKLDAMDWDALPTLHHIVERLAEIPIYEVVGGKVVEGVGVPDVAGAGRVE